ncbi:MAG: potassium efflux system protein [Arenicella sp.]|jgi:potassium efflux system protein
MFRILVFIVAAFTIANVQSADEFARSVVSQSLESIDLEAFDAEFRGGGELDESIRRVSKIRSSILLCIANGEKELNSFTTILGKGSLDDVLTNTDKSREEKRITGVVSELNQQIQDCKLLLDKSSNLLDRLSARQIELNKAKLVEKKQHLGLSLIEGLPQLPGYLRGALTNKTNLPKMDVNPVQNLIVALGAFGLLIVGFFIRLRSVMPKIDPKSSFSFHFTTVIGFLALRWAPLLLPATFTVGYLFFVIGYQFGHTNLNKLLMFGIGYISVQILLRASVRRYTQFLADTQQIDFPGPALYVRLVISSCLLGAWVLFVILVGAQGDLNPGESLFRTLLSIAILVSLIEIARYLNQIPSFPRIASLGRWLSTGAFGLALLLECLGYHNISRFVWIGIVLSAVSLTFFYVVESLLRDFYDGLETGQRPWQQSFRETLSVQNEEPVPGLIWFRLLSITSVWIALGVGILKAWGTPNSVIASLFDFARNGFKLGETLLTPFNLVLGVLIFAILLMIFRWFRDGLDTKYLSRSHMDSGAREAVVTITGYVGFVIAALTGLSIAGVSFGSMAIVAGALSLGIGFGLQNIVNNFVSGIILLFERPIRTGDWIVIGSTEGYVKKIRVRSTEVQTFDRSDVIVPNSELISTQVTNWTLRDNHGRVIVSVGVAYGSNTALVKELLLKATKGIPQIISNDLQMPVTVLFRKFGDSTLDFELRVFIYNIDSALEVQSELYFAIDALFREHGVEIAFPQRDIHIRSGA